MKAECLSASLPRDLRFQPNLQRSGVLIHNDRPTNPVKNNHSNKEKVTSNCSNCRKKKEKKKVMNKSMRALWLY